MSSSVLISALIAELAICIILGIYTAAGCKSKKKAYYIGFILALFLYTLGYFMEVTSNSFGGVFAGLKVEYLGAALIAQVFLLFIMDLCDIKISAKFVLPLFIIPIVTIVLVWTSQYHQYYYTSMAFTSQGGINGIHVSGGTWYYVHYAFAFLCLLASCFCVIRYYLRLSRDMRKQAPLLLVSPLLQLVPQFMYAGGIRMGGVFYPVLCLVVTALLLFVYLMRYNVLDVVSQISDIASDFMKDAFMLVDKEYYLLHANRAAEELLKRFGKTGKGRRIDRLGAWPPELGNLENFANEDGSVTFKLDDGGESRCFRADVNKVTSSGGQLIGWVILIIDVTETTVLVERMEAIAFVDELTGLINRNRFTDLARKEFDIKRDDKRAELSVIFIGMDNYKKINDVYGDDAGDALLRLVSQNLKSILGDHPLLARFSGPQFILLVDMDAKQAEELAGRIKNEIAYRAYEAGGVIVKCTASIGIASKSPGASTLEEVVHNARESLRRAQSKGYSRIESFI